MPEQQPLPAIQESSEVFWVSVVPEQQPLLPLCRDVFEGFRDGAATEQIGSFLTRPDVGKVDGGNKVE